jgi:hypothetical protein
MWLPEKEMVQFPPGHDFALEQTGLLQLLPQQRPEWVVVGVLSGAICQQLTTSPSAGA